MSSSSDKITLLVFASHHLLGNVASQRFIALTKYLPKEKYNIHIFSKLKDNPLLDIHEQSNITVHGLKGECVGSGASKIESLFVFISAKLRFLPFFVTMKNTWLNRSIKSAEKVLADERIPTKNTFIIATYSPIDTLVAAQCLAKKYRIPCILDFRDGFVFEGLGRNGLLARIFRKWIEKNVVQGAALITTVSSPLVAYFRKNYRNHVVKLLPNGFDPEEFLVDCSTPDVAIADKILSTGSTKKFVISHVGRVGASDGSSTEALKSLVEIINNLKERDKLHLLFVGVLTTNEQIILDELQCTKTLSKPVKRSVAQLIMKNSDALMLITGNRSSCVTGKIFEYMASETPIVCCSRVENEAMKILRETGCGEGFIAGDNKVAMAIFSKLISSVGNQQVNSILISTYSRQEQAILLDRWIQESERIKLVTAE